MKTILVPTDFSENAQHALQYAAGLAQELSGKIIIAHVIARPVTPLDGNLTIPVDWNLPEDYTAELNQQAENLKKQYPAITITTICQHGYLFTDLNELVKAHHVDLVVMGTTDAGDFVTNLIGTNTFGFMQEAHCPVLAIPMGVTYTGIKNIAYASSFENTEKNYLQQLSGVAAAFQAQVSIVNIKSERQLDLVDDAQIIKEIQKQFPTNAFCVAQKKQNNIQEGIQQFIQETQADILAMAMQERSFLEELFHKSLTKQLLHQTPLPLLSLPAKPYRTFVTNPA
jgi:nucleotide-binding universal stress UspA family protein